MYPYSLSPLVQSQQSTTFIDQQAEQQYLTKMEQISANEENKIQHSSVCLYLCQNNCMQQCMQQNGSLERCSISCDHSCDNNRACDESQQQLLLLPAPTASSFITTIVIINITTTTSTATYAPLSLTQIQQIQQQIPEQLLQQQPNCTQQTS
ncbi:Uncharacterized protein BM_BM11546 [Brugia malayi]|uniref:Bm11546 n=1 Tax=Brugia malayi TaxID=6279 RepID=A0A4E9EWC8_BRUMA|nr:Uncharacterized protein BM_BM11546 [Brugia malayi]VIO88265.1 Uncharacterized protein BM_BM11546 [Brugia malayi]